MLKQDALSQLTQLKQDIRASKDIAQGTVRGSNGKFGFAVLDDGREAFITPNDMNRVFPGDRIQINVVPGKGGKPQAEIEKLLDSPLSAFVGQYTVKGQGHFVEPDLPQFSRWLFVPPSQRKGLKAGDYLHCRISQHPFHKDGKAQVKVLERFGDLKQAGIEAKYMASKFALSNTESPAVSKQLETLSSTANTNSEASSLPFVTIDSSRTLDMDDAVAAQKLDSGYRLWVAIADPSDEISAGSALEQQALERGQTVYLPGSSVQMMPSTLSQERYSLQAGESRPCLVAQLDISEQGEITSHEFSQGTVSSLAKLNYEQVATFLQSEGDGEFAANIASSLRTLAEVAACRREYRLREALVMEDKADYDIELGEDGKIQNIKKTDKNLAHKMIEEAMLATNICAAKFFQEHKAAALFTAHAGFRDDKLATIQEVLKADQPELAELDISTLEGYRALMQTTEQKAPELYHTFKRLLQSSQLCNEAKPHLGLGLEAYATITSPIRRYQDLYNHGQLKAILNSSSEKANTLAAEQIEQLQKQLGNGRQAVRQMEQWLHCQWMKKQVGSEHQATIALVNGQGVGVRFNDTGVEGFAMLQNKEKPWELDHRRLKLVRDDTVYRLGQEVTVVVKSIDMKLRRIAVELKDAQ